MFSCFCSLENVRGNGVVHGPAFVFGRLMKSRAYIGDKCIAVLKFSICNSIGGRLCDTQRDRQTDRQTDRDRDRQRRGRARRGSERGRGRKRGELSGESEASNIHYNL